MMNDIKKDSWNPQQYEKFKNERSQPFFDLMTMLQPVADPKVIDLGCGTGELTFILHNHLKSKSTIGIDSSKEMLSKAESLRADALEFKQGQIENFVEVNQYDVVFSNAAVQWCDDHPQLLKNFKSALRPGGQLAIQMPMNHDYPTHILAAQMSNEAPWNSLLNGQPYTQDKTMLSSSDYARELFRLGFKNQKVNVRVYGHILDSREGVVEWVTGTLLTYFKSRLSTENYQKFLEDYKTRLFQILPNERPFFYPFKRMLLWAQA